MRLISTQDKTRVRALYKCNNYSEEQLNNPHRKKVAGITFSMKTIMDRKLKPLPGHDNDIV